MTQATGQSLADIMGLTGHVPEVKHKQTNVIDSFSLDNEIYKDIYSESPEIQAAVKEGDEIIRTFPDFAQDLYMGLYKHKPQLMEEEDIKKTHKFNHQLMSQVMDLPEFRELRRQTRLDVGAATIGMQAMSEKAVTIIREYEQQAKEQGGGEGGGGMQSPFKDINDQMDQQGSGGQGGDGADEQPDDGSDGSGGEQEMEMPPIDEKAMADAVEKMRKAVGDVTEDVTETRDFLKAWGMDGGNATNRVTFEDKRIALERLRKSNKLKRLSDIVGRMKRLAVNEKPEKDDDGAESITSVITGDEFQSVLPSERALLASSDPNIKKLFYRKFHEKELLQYDKDVYESKGKGPMIVCVDTSGSMEGARERWSKAVALALLEVAQKQKRNFACIHYDGHIQGTWRIPAGELRPNDIFDIAEQFSSGGTNFENPLRESLKIIEEEGFSKSDIVFITDGDCRVSDTFMDKFLEKKKELGFHVQTVLIDMDGGGGRSGVNRFSDKITNVSNLAKLDKQEEGALDIFKNVQ